MIVRHVVSEGVVEGSWLPALAHLGESLMSVEPRWRVARLLPGHRGDPRPELANLMRELEVLSRSTVEVALVVAVGRLVRVGGQVALAGPEPRDAELLAREDASLPLSAIRERLRGARARTVCVVAGWPERDEAPRPEREGAAVEEIALAEECVAALSTGRGDELIAVGLAARAGPTIEALRDGLVGAALDEHTGTITARSLAEHLARSIPGLALRAPSGAPLSASIATPPPLVSQWDPRLTRRGKPAVSPPERSEPETLVGSILPGRFRIDALIARGGFGFVYRAHQLSVGRDVALKVMHGGVDAASPAGRLFVQEIQSVGRIDHPNVVRIYQADVTPAGRLFFVMELLGGRDLEQVIREEGLLDPARVIAIGAQLLAGLGAAHEAGLIHADLKPANLLLVPGKTGERAVLVDFGLSRLRSPDAPSRSVGGTPAYMAPEQLRNGRVDARSDLFAAALVLVTLLTGWRRRSRDELVPPLDGVSDPRLRDVLSRALAPRPAERFATAAELASALRGEGAGAQPVGPRVAVPLPTFVDAASDRLYGRDRELELLARHVFDRRTVVVDGVAGAGKTTLLRHGLVPYLRALGAHVVYAAASAGGVVATGHALAHAIEPGSRDVATAIERRCARGGGRLVLIVDQLEALAEDPRRLDEIVQLMLGTERWPADAEVSAVLGVRAHDTARLRADGSGAAAMTLGLLDEDGAREAILGLFAERRLTIDDDLLAALLRDLSKASSSGSRRGIHPPHLQRACSALYESLHPEEARLTLGHYTRAGGAAIFDEPASTNELPAVAVPAEAPHHRRRARLLALAPGVAGAVAVAVAVAVPLLGGIGREPSGTPPSPAAGGTTSGAPAYSITVGGTAVVIFGVIEPLRTFLEKRTGATLPVETKFDVGSGGAMRSLGSREVDVAAMSERFDGPAPRGLRSANYLVVEVPIGYDETTLFVHRGNPQLRIELAAIRAHLCCAPGERVGAVTWEQLGASMPGMEGLEVIWTLFGRSERDRAGGAASSTLRLADEWLCSPLQLCPSKAPVLDASAREILQEHVTDARVIALSNRAFETPSVAPLVVVDSERGLRLDGRKALWLYLPVERGHAFAVPICKFLDAILDGAVATRLPNIAPLPDAARRRQRQALGLDDGTCAALPILEPPGASPNDEGMVWSPVAAEIEISSPWVPASR